MFARVSVVLLLFTAVAVAADQVDRRSRDEPEVVVQAGGRAGTCDVVRFTPDGKFLLAAGDDKVAYVWPHGEAGLVTDPEKVRVLHWPAWREKRGGIKSIAVSPDGKRVVVGGVGMLVSSVAILDREKSDSETTHTAAFTWPKVRDGKNDFGAVTAVAFSPDGKRVAFGTADGSLWVWTPAKLAKPDADGRDWSAPVRAGKHSNGFPNAEKDDNRSRLIVFRDAVTLLSVSKAGQVLECPITDTLTDDPLVAAPKGNPLFNLNDGLPVKGRVFQAGLTADGKGVVAGIVAEPSFLLVRSLDKKETVRIDLPKDHFPRGLAVHPVSGRIAVGVGGVRPAAPNVPRFYLEKDDEVWVFDAPKNGAEPDVRLTGSARAEAIAFHPTLKDRLAVAGGDADEVTLYDLENPRTPLTVAKGAGRKVFGVSIEGNGKLIRVRSTRDPKATHPNALGTGEWSGFDLTRLNATDDTGDQGRTWTAAIDTADGWRVEPDAKNRAVWYVAGAIDGKNARIPLNIDTAQFNEPTCYTFLPKVGNTPTRLLVGHYHGCSLFDLPVGGAAPKELVPARIFMGHTAEVLSIAVAKDASWFVTGGADQTVAAFALDRTAATLGAKFEAVKGQDVFQVTAVEDGSPAWETGLQVGDRIDLLAVGGELVFDRRPKNPAAGTTADALARLTDPASGVELFFGVLPKGGGRARTTNTTLPHRPLWKWFPAFDDRNRLNDWVIWMWKGSYYHTKSANGDRLVGWHVNAPTRSGSPRFHQLNAFEKQYHRVDVIRKLIAARSTVETLKFARGDNPLSFSAHQPAAVDLGLSASELSDRAIEVNVSVRPGGSDVDLLPERVELWVNDYRVQTWPGDPKRAFEQTKKLPPELFRAGENQVSVLTFNPAGGRAEAKQTIMNANPAAAPNLLGLAVGVDDYGARGVAGGGARSALTNLNYAYSDAAGLSSALERHVGADKFFPTGKLNRARDAEAVRKKLLADLAGLKTTAKPNDILVLFLAGHGVLIGDKEAVVNGKKEVKTEVIGEGVDAELYKNVRFVFCCADFEARNPVPTSIPAEELFNALSEVNCRKVVLFDVCHSGEAAEANVVRRFVPDGQGPVVIASCNNSERSYEHPKLKHGLFTAALLDAVGDEFMADRNRDGRITYAELTAFVSERVSNLRRETTGKLTSDQNPISFPRRPSDAVMLRQTASR